MSDADRGRTEARIGTAHVIISGRVQGVAFRYFARRMAESLGLAGWIRNRPDGRVEAVLRGPRDNVEAGIRWCRTGPPSARVEEVEVTWSDLPEEYHGFEIRG